MINTRRLPAWVSGLKAWKDDAVVVATWGGHVGNLEGSTGPWKVVQALREQSGMSTPIRATLWIHAVESTPSPSRSSSSTGVSHSGHNPPKPTERANKLQSPHRRSPRNRSPHPPHS